MRRLFVFASICYLFLTTVFGVAEFGSRWNSSDVRVNVSITVYQWGELSLSYQGIDSETIIYYYGNIERAPQSYPVVAVVSLHTNYDSIKFRVKKWKDEANTGILNHLNNSKWRLFRRQPMYFSNDPSNDPRNYIPQNDWANFGEYVTISNNNDLGDYLSYSSNNSFALGIKFDVDEETDPGVYNLKIIVEIAPTFSI